MIINTKLSYLNQPDGDTQSTNGNLEQDEEMPQIPKNNFLQVPSPYQMMHQQRKLFKGVSEQQFPAFSQNLIGRQTENNNLQIQSSNFKLKSMQNSKNRMQNNQQELESTNNFKMNTSLIGRALMIDYLKLLLNFYQKIKKNSFLSQEDIPELELKQMADYQHEKFSVIYYQMMEKRVNQNKPLTEGDFLFTIFKTKMKSFLLMGLFCILFFSCKLTSSVLIQQLLQALTENSEKNQIYMWASIICALQLLMNIFDQFYVRLLAVEQKLITNIIMKHVHTKVYSLSAFTISQNNIGQLMNIITNDLKIIDSRISETLKIPILPLPTIAAGLISYFRFGALSLIGLAVLIICVPLQALLGKISKHYFSQRAKVNDKRMQITHEVLESIRLIKLYSWEEAFIKMLNIIRSKDLRLLLITQILQSIENAISLSSGLLSSFLIFYLVYQFDGPASLTVANMFSTVEIFSFLRSDIMSSSGVGIAGLFEIKVVMKRIIDILQIQSQEMLSINQINQGEETKSTIEFQFQTVGDIKLTNFSAFWKYDASVIKELSCSIQTGELVTVFGSVSSGKSSLLNCFIKEVPFYKGDIAFKGKIAYVEQEPFIFNMSLRDNILFGSNYNIELYEKVISVSHLANDIEMLGGDDNIEIGEKGSNLSGGQRARLALARALYQQADIYLLDDPLSALDYNVIKDIFQNAIKDFLKGKTILLTTHNLDIVQQSDYVIVLESGQVVNQGKPNDIKDYLESLRNKSRKSIESENENDKVVVQCDNSPTEPKEINDDQSMIDLIKMKNTKKIKKDLELSLQESTHSFKSKMQLCSYNQLTIKKNKQNIQSSFVLSSLQKNDSDLKNQQVSYRTYLQYFSFGAYKFLLFICILLYMSNEIIYIFFTKTLGNFDGIHVNSYSRYLFELGMFTFGYFGVMLIKKVLLNSLLNNTNYQLHLSMIKSVLSSKIAYFDNTPIGSIINRFSSDLSNLDLDLSRQLSDSLEVVCNTLTLVLTLILLNPYFIIVAAVSAVVLYWFFSKSKDVLIATKQLDLNQKSRVFSFFNTSIQGILPIKVCKQINQFKLQFNQILNSSLRSYYSYWFTNRGFGMYIIFIAQITSIIGIYMAIMINSNSSDLGQTITFFISIGSKLQAGLRQKILNIVILQILMIQHTSFPPKF